MRFSKQNHSRIPMPGKPGTCRLQVRDLGVTLEGESILRDITFQLNCREIMALIGPNGAGKSSLFRSILGQIPYSGSIQFQLAGGYPSHPKIGYVPQSPSFDRGYPISVLDFFAAAISRWPVFLPVPAGAAGPGAGAHSADSHFGRASVRGRCGGRASAAGYAGRDPAEI